MRAFEVEELIGTVVSDDPHPFEVGADKGCPAHQQLSYLTDCDPGGSEICMAQGDTKHRCQLGKTFPPPPAKTPPRPDKPEGELAALRRRLRAAQRR